jgi:hypothetical protein
VGHDGGVIRTTSHCKTCRKAKKLAVSVACIPDFGYRILGAKHDACLRGTVKLQRAHGGCLGDQRRRRTWTAAKSSGEPLTGFDPEISEWGNPRRDYLPAHGEYIAMTPPSQGTETSKYLDESKSNETPLVVASERGRA